jgi:DNA invertase Pin-like site-specific DNA recombinase
VTTLKNQGISFKSLTENIDTSTATGTLVFQIFGALAEFERNLITERTVAGLEAARMRGRKGGRPRRSPSSGRVALAKQLYSNRTLSIPDILKTLNVSKSTLYRWLDLPTYRPDLVKGKRAKP